MAEKTGEIQENVSCGFPGCTGSQATVWATYDDGSRSVISNIPCTGPHVLPTASGN